MQSEIVSIAKEIVSIAESNGILARLMGGVAVWIRCPGVQKTLLSKTRRSGDIDLVVANRHRRKFECMLSEKFNLLLDPQLGSIPGEIHARFYTNDGKRLCDVSYDKILYCHNIDMRKRLDKDPLTIPLAELLLTKLQIAEPSHKDIIDTIALTAEHAFGSADGNICNLSELCRRCRADWALEHTAQLSLNRCYGMLLEMPDLDIHFRTKTALRLLQLAGALHVDGKSFRWRMRSLLGAKKRWYNVVEYLHDPLVEDLRRAF